MEKELNQNGKLLLKLNQELQSVSKDMREVFELGVTQKLQQLKISKSWITKCIESNQEELSKALFKSKTFIVSSEELLTTFAQTINDMCYSLKTNNYVANIEYVSFGKCLSKYGHIMDMYTTNVIKQLLHSMGSVTTYVDNDNLIVCKKMGISLKTFKEKNKTNSYMEAYEDVDFMTKYTKYFAINRFLEIFEKEQDLFGINLKNTSISDVLIRTDEVPENIPKYYFEVTYTINAKDIVLKKDETLKDIYKHLLMTSKCMKQLGLF